MMTFLDIDGAKETRERLDRYPELEKSRIEAEAIVARGEEGKIQVSEPGSAGIGATLGAVGAGIVGILTGPIILPMLIATGAIAGGIAGHLAGRILPTEDLDRVAQQIPPGSSAWLAVVDAEHAPNVLDVFRGTGARALDIPIDADATNAIREGLLREVTRA
jgi:uncharacterized membrane protein